jgi:hypothetical protein
MCDVACQDTTCCQRIVLNIRFNLMFDEIYRLDCERIELFTMFII